MQKVVIDTNVIVSSLIQRSYPYKIIYELFVDDKFVLCVSEELMSEYYKVLSRPKFVKFPDFFGKAESLLADIETKSKKFVPITKLDLISDKDDNMILELADICLADFVITGNTNDFTFSTYKQTKIINPKEYWENYAPE
jgi:putative PIN family toxin of toxin-antitoxin system